VCGLSGTRLFTADWRWEGFSHHTLSSRTHTLERSPVSPARNKIGTPPVGGEPKARTRWGRPGSPPVRVAFSPFLIVATPRGISHNQPQWNGEKHVPFSQALITLCSPKMNSNGFPRKSLESKRRPSSSQPESPFGSVVHSDNQRLHGPQPSHPTRRRTSTGQLLNR
jgi:hypothetical protein